MSDWLKIHPKVFGALATAAVLILGHDSIAAAGVNVSATWQTLLPLILSYFIPGGADAPSK